jgi:hypothetical protein
MGWYTQTATQQDFFHLIRDGICFFFFFFLGGFSEGKDTIWIEGRCSDDSDDSDDT